MKSRSDADELPTGIKVLTMARRQGWSRSFRRDSKLQHYFLNQVVPTGKTLGTGSYGSVLEVSELF